MEIVSAKRIGNALHLHVKDDGGVEFASVWEPAEGGNEKAPTGVESLDQLEARALRETALIVAGPSNPMPPTETLPIEGHTLLADGRTEAPQR